MAYIGNKMVTIGNKMVNIGKGYWVDGQNVTLPKSFIKKALNHYITNAMKHGLSDKEADGRLRKTMTETGVPAHLQETLSYWMRQEK